MKAFISHRGIVGQLTRGLCLILSLSLLLIEFPVNYSSAQQISQGGVPIEGQGISQGTVPFLGEQERRYSEQECIGFQKTINTLSDPAYEKGLEKQVEPLRKLLDEAEPDFESAKSEARTVMMNAAKELTQLGWGKFREKWSKDLLKWRLEKIREKYGYETPHGVPAYKWIKFTKDLDSYSNKVEDYLNELDVNENYLNDMNELRLRTQKAAGKAKDLRKSLRDLTKDAAETGVLNDLLDKTVLATPIPLDDIANSLGKLGIGLTLTQMAKADRKRELDQARENFLPALDRKLRTDIDLDNARSKYNTYCKLKPMEAEKAKTPEPPPPPVVAQPSETEAPAPKTGMSAGTILAIVAGVVGLSAGVYYAATQLVKDEDCTERVCTRSIFSGACSCVITDPSATACSLPVVGAGGVCFSGNRVARCSSGLSCVNGICSNLC